MRKRFVVPTADECHLISSHFHSSGAIFGWHLRSIEAAERIKNLCRNTKWVETKSNSEWCRRMNFFFFLLLSSFSLRVDLFYATKEATNPCADSARTFIYEWKVCTNSKLFFFHVSSHLWVRYGVASAWCVQYTIFEQISYKVYILWVVLQENGDVERREEVNEKESV